MLEGNLGCLYANLLLQAGGSDQIAEGFEQTQLGLTPPPQDGLTQSLGHLLQCLTALRGKTAEL